MKIKTLFLLALFAVTWAMPRPAEARSEISFDFFYDALSPHGEWIDVGDYGTCWRPRGVDADWRPYSDGYWSYTDGGWTWVSYEEFGGIVYHYGRWVEVDDEGWCWVPDYEWAPAWVSWRSNDDYVGWAPLPPEARWERKVGFSVWVDSHYDIGPSRFNFCRVRDFGAPYLRPVIVNRFENVTIIQRTVNVTNISYYDDYEGGGYGGLVHCGGPSFVVINSHVHRPIPALKLVRNTNITNINIHQSNVFNSVARGNQLSVLAPRVAPPKPDFVRPVAVRSIPAAKVSKGWGGVKDQKVADDIRGQMRQQARGLTPESAPARRVQAAELKMLPAKADPDAPSNVRTARDRTPGTGKKPVAGAPGQPTPEKPSADKDKAPADKPVDARTAERMLREKAREQTADKAADKPAATVENPAKTRTLPKPQVTQVPEGKEATKEQNERGRQSIRSIPTPAAPSSSGDTKKESPQTSGRTPTVRQRPSGDNEDKARAASVAAQQRAAAEQNERAATLSRLRATEDAARKQKAQTEVAREMQRRPQAITQPKREVPAPVKRSAPSDDSAQKAASQQRQMEAARRQQAESAQRQQSSENARRSQVEAARNAQAAQASRQQQQMESARREQASQAARQQQMEAPRRQQAAPAPRQQPVQRQVAPPAPPAPRGAPAPSSRKESLSKEELEALKKARGR